MCCTLRISRLTDSAYATFLRREGREQFPSVSGPLATGGVHAGPRLSTSDPDQGFCTAVSYSSASKSLFSRIETLSRVGASQIHKEERMKQLACCLTLLLLVTMCFAQQQGQPPPDTQQPPYGTPPTFPGQPQTPGQRPTRPLPPDEQAPPPEAMSTEAVQQQITNQLSSERALERTNVDAKVSDNSVVLTGNVDSEEQHGLAVSIAQSYAGDRKIVDKIEVRQRHSGGGTK